MEPAGTGSGWHRAAPASPHSGPCSPRCRRLGTDAPYEETQCSQNIQRNIFSSQPQVHFLKSVFPQLWTKLWMYVCVYESSLSLYKNKVYIFQIMLFDS